MTKEEAKTLGLPDKITPENYIEVLESLVAQLRNGDRDLILGAIVHYARIAQLAFLL